MHPCLASPYCLRRVEDYLVACKDHWFMLPKILRDRIRVAFREGAGGPAHVQVLKSARTYLHRKLDQARPHPDGDALDPALDPNKEPNPLSTDDLGMR